MSGLRTIMTSVWIITTLGLGYGSWSMVSSEEWKRKEIIKNLPESNPVRMEETRKRNALVMQALKEAAETNDNIAREIRGPMK